MAENSLPDDNSLKPYQPITPPENLDPRSRRKEASPIYLIDHQPQATEVWPKVEEFLWFRKTYLRFPRQFPNPPQAIQVARASVAGYQNQDLADSLGVSIGTVAWTRRLVERTLLILPESYEFLAPAGFQSPPPTPQELRVATIYHRFREIPALLEEEKNQQTKLGLLLDDNPHVDYLLKYFAGGKSAHDLTAEMNLGRTSKTGAKQITEKILNLFMNGEKSAQFHILARSLLFSRCLRREQNWYGPSLSFMFADAATYAITVPPAETGNRHFFFQLAIFVRLLPALHLSLMREEGWQNTDVRTVFPEATSREHDPYKLDTRAYLQRYRDWKMLPHPISILAKAYMNGTIGHDILDRLAAIGIPHKRNALNTYILIGLRFLDNLSLVKNIPDNWSRYQSELFRSRSTETDQIIHLLAERIRLLNEGSART